MEPAPMNVTHRSAPPSPTAGITSRLNRMLAAAATAGGVKNRPPTWHSHAGRLRS